MQKTNSQLKSWLFGKPVLFSILSFLSIFIFILIYSLIASFISIDFEYNPWAALIFCILPFIYPVYYTIKKLPHDKMQRHDFVAIVNGCAFISIIFSLLTIPYFFNMEGLRKYMLQTYVTQPALFNTIIIALTFVALYLIGVAVSGVYAKYKRCSAMGISSWKIILSMPFAFLMLWTPGYLIEEKTKKSNMEIKSVWFNKFNKWVLSNFSNTLMVFLFVILFKSVVAGITTLVLTIALLAIYTLWYIKHKSDFIKNINKGYALTAVGINVATIIAVLLQFIRI